MLPWSATRPGPFFCDRPERCLRITFSNADVATVGQLGLPLASTCLTQDVPHLTEALVPASPRMFPREA